MRQTRSRLWKYQHRYNRSQKVPTVRRLWLSRLKIGDRVWCLYDGKFGRAQLGVVVWHSRGVLKVRFLAWADAKQRVVLGNFEENTGVGIDNSGKFCCPSGKYALAKYFGDLYELQPLNHPDLTRRFLDETIHDQQKRQFLAVAK